jgi:hypothetical protein
MIFTISSLIVLAGCCSPAGASVWRAATGGEGGMVAARSSAPMTIRMTV